MKKPMTEPLDVIDVWEATDAIQTAYDYQDWSITGTITLPVATCDTILKALKILEDILGEKNKV